MFGKKKSSNKNLKKLQESLRQRASNQPTSDDIKKIHYIRQEVKELFKMYPGSPEFLGRAEYTVKRSRISFLNRKYPDISDIRDIVNKFSTSKELTDPRTRIRKLLKKHPAYPDLRALNAIQIFNDSAQSGLDSKKIKVIQGSLREITRAMYNGGLSLFNVNWFIKIYIKYIDSLREKLLHEYNALKSHFSPDIRQLSEEIHRKHLQLTVMATVKNKLSGLAMLNAKLKGSIYTISTISKDEVKKACHAIKDNDGSRKIGDSGKTANHTLFIIMTLNIMFARIPILDHLVKMFQKSIPDINRDVILQKVMVNNMRRVTEFQLSMAMGNKTKTRDVANKMYLDNIEITKQYLEHGVLMKQHEVDPIIKTAWIMKEAKGLYDDKEYRKHLENALQVLEIIFNKRVQVKGANEIARHLQDDIHFIMIEHGWMK